MVYSGASGQARRPGPRDRDAVPLSARRVRQGGEPPRRRRARRRRRRQLLFGPADGATVSRPPTLRWAKIGGARYYNVQLWYTPRRGAAAEAAMKKVYTAWPGKNQVKLKKKWRYSRQALHAEARHLSLVRLARSRPEGEQRLRRPARPERLRRQEAQVTAVDRADVLVVGRLLADIYPNQLRTPLSEIESFTRFVGGFAGNVATGLARLGVSAAMLSRVGDDGHGEFCRAFLEREGVDMSWVGVDPTYRTALAFCEAWPPGPLPDHVLPNARAAPTGRSPSTTSRWSEAARIPWALLTGTGLARSPSRDVHFAPRRGAASTRRRCSTSTGGRCSGKAPAPTAHTCRRCSRSSTSSSATRASSARSPTVTPCDRPLASSNAGRASSS